MARKVIDLTGQRFGNFTVIKRSEEKDTDNQIKWLCQCDCGNEKVVRGSELKNGKVTSCGCSTKTHGLSKTRLHVVWCGMKQRCYNKNRDSYKWYGAKGVTVCEEWRNSFESFYNWAMANGYDENAKTGQCTLDRIDPFGNYEPSNCRWVDSKVQANNQRKNRGTK